MRWGVFLAYFCIHYSFFFNSSITLFSDEASCIDVKILSRFFEAKLTVCNCSLVENEESSQQGESYQILKECRRRLNTVIFSSRACGDVELEVANLIRIHPPWKEVQVTGSDKIIILATYFSQMSI